jgi:fatty acid amide hydrolase
LIQISGVPAILRRPIAALLEMLGQGHAARSMRELRPCDAREYWRLCAERTRYRMRFGQAMNDQGVDVLVCPPYGLPAPLIGSNGSGAGTIASSHANLFNVLGMPAGVVAAGCVGPEEESDRPHTRDRTECDAALIEKGSAGMPIGVQVVGRHWREDQVFAVMKALETHFGQDGYKWPPLSSRQTSSATT